MRRSDLFKSKPGHCEWLGLLARVHQGRVEVANLMGLREAEERSIAALGILDGRMPTQGLKLAIAKLRTRFHLDTGNLSEALVQSQRLVELAREAGGREDIAKSIGWQAMIHRERSENEKALELYNEAEALVQHKLSLAELWQEKGLTYTYVGRYENAEELLTKSLAVFRSIGSTERIAGAVNDLGVCCYQQMKYRRSQELFEEAMGLFLRIGYKLGSATTAGNLANIYLHQGEIGRAIYMAEKCLEWGTEIEDMISMGLGHEKIGTVYQALGMPVNALDHLNKAEECAAITGDFVVKGLVLGLKAEVLVELGRMKEADILLSEAEKLGRETGEEMLIYRIEAKRAWLTSKLGDYALATRRWDKVIRQTADKEGRKSGDEAKLERAACLLALGEGKSAKSLYHKISIGGDYSIFWFLRYHALGVEIGRAIEDGPMTEEHGAEARRIAQQLLEANQEGWIRARLLSVDPLKKLSDLGCL